MNIVISFKSFLVFIIMLATQSGLAQVTSTAPIATPVQDKRVEIKKTKADIAAEMMERRNAQVISANEQAEGNAPSKTASQPTETMEHSTPEKINAKENSGENQRDETDVMHQPSKAQAVEEEKKAIRAAEDPEKKKH